MHGSIVIELLRGGEGGGGGGSLGRIRGENPRLSGRLFCEIRISLPAIVIITHLTSHRID